MWRSFISENFFLCSVEKKTTRPKWSHSSQVTKPGLTASPKCSSSLPQKCSLTQPVRNFLISTSEVICHMSPLHLPNEDEIIHLIRPPAPPLQGKVTLSETILSFLLPVTTCSTLLPIKIFHFAQFLSVSVLARWEAARLRHCFNKAN